MSFIYFKFQFYLYKLPEFQKKLSFEINFELEAQNELEEKEIKNEKDFSFNQIEKERKNSLEKYQEFYKFSI